LYKEFEENIENRSFIDDAVGRKSGGSG